MILPLHTSLQTQLLPEQSLLHHQWRSSDLTHFRPAHQALFAALLNHRVRYWLADATNLPDFTIEHHLWGLKNLLPKLLRLPLTRMALVLDSNPVNRWVLETALFPVHGLLPFDLQLFDDAHAALFWLTDGDASLAACEAEWAAGAALLEPKI
jgi:hypothetical protein